MFFIKIMPSKEINHGEGTLDCTWQQSQLEVMRKKQSSQSKLISTTNLFETSRPEDIPQPAKSPPRNRASDNTTPNQEPKGLVDLSIGNAVKSVERPIVEVPKEMPTVLETAQQPAVLSQPPEENQKPFQTLKLQFLPFKERVSAATRS